MVPARRNAFPKSRSNLIPLALAATAENGPELQVYGSDYPTPGGTCVRDYIHVNDLADAHVRALQFLESGADEKRRDSLAINLGTGRGYSVLEVMKAAENMLGWTAKRNLADIVSSTWTWMQKNSSGS